ncbi:MAG: hypothetical protein ACRCX8_11765 [Sarcina sp.]
MDVKPRYWKYDTELGIVFYCPVCKAVVHTEHCKCGQQLDTKNEIHDETQRIKWK